MKSMTGFASGGITCDGNGISVEIKSYNSRYLDIFISSPPEFNFLEKSMRDMIAGVCKRGKIEVTINSSISNNAAVYKINKNALQSALGVFVESAKDIRNYFDEHEIKLNTPDLKFTLKDILDFEGVLEKESADTLSSPGDEGKLKKELLSLLAQALETLDDERKREGESTQKDILFLLDNITAMVKNIEKIRPAVELELQNNLRKRFTEIIGDSGITVDESRILAETAVLLNKYTINEELSRLDAHLTEMRRCVLSDDAPGKKLDFLCQEINREANTIGAKTQNIETCRYVVNIKDANENIREQLRNIE